MYSYCDLMRDVLNFGVYVENRTGTKAKTIFGGQIRHDLSSFGFPLLTTKKMYIKGIVEELLWLLSGKTDVQSLNARGVHIWDKDADRHDRGGDLGPIYGKQYRRWYIGNGVEFDQIASAIKKVKEDPDSRQNIVSAWNVADIPYMALPPCHVMYQLRVLNGMLNCHVYQRSADMFLGVPFNLASYGLLTHMIAHVCGIGVGMLVWSGGDIHIYENHVEQCMEQMNRDPYPLPTLKFNRHVESIDDFKYEDIVIENYQCHPAIKGELA